VKILHTSDWHIGRKLYDKSFDETLPVFFDWLKKTIEEEKIDVLIVAGDVFNNPFPSTSSLSVYYKALYELSKSNLKHIIITGGNHDSISTLNAPRELLNILNISVVGGYADNLDDLIIEIKENSETKLVVCAVPFLRERDVRTSFSGNNYSERIKQISDGISSFYSEIAKKVEHFKEQNIPIIATGHLFVNDLKEMPDDEKKLFIGGLQQLSFNQLPQFFDYFALGHIHKAYKIGGLENVRYSGSPIHLNFGERKNKSQVIIVDFSEKVDIQVKKVPIFRNLVHFKGSFVEVSEMIKNYEPNTELKPWADIEIVEEKQNLLLEKELLNLKNSTEKIEIIRYKYTFTDIENEIEQKFKKNTNLKDLKPEQIFETILENVEENDRDEISNTFKELLNSKLEKE